MNIIGDYQGYIYYNELLYYIMKYSMKEMLEKKDFSKDYEQAEKIMN